MITNITHYIEYNICIPKNTPTKVLLKGTTYTDYVRFSENVQIGTINKETCSYENKKDGEIIVRGDFTKEHYLVDSSDRTKICFVDPLNKSDIELKEFDLNLLLLDFSHNVGPKDCYLKNGSENNVKNYRNFACCEEFSLVKGEEYKLIINPKFESQIYYDRIRDVVEKNCLGAERYIEIYRAKANESSKYTFTNSNDAFVFFYQF